MPQKRKQLIPLGTTTKRQKGPDSRRLIELPRETLDLILGHVLPRLSDFGYGTEPLSIAKLFTQPILQTSRFLRRQCLDLIHHISPWVYVHTLNCVSLDSLINDLGHLPRMLNEFEYLITESAPKIHMTLKATSLPPLGYGYKAFDYGTHTFIFPYNFVILLWICQFTHLSVRHGLVGDLLVDLCGFGVRFEKKLLNLVITALSTIHVSLRPYFRRNGIDLDPEDAETLPSKYASLENWSLNETLQRSQDVLYRTSLLEASGYDNEAGALLLASNTIETIANNVLPAPIDWRLHNLVPEESEQYPGQSAKGNQLRRLVHQIEYRACLAFVKLSKIYGRRWCEAHECLFGHRSRFLVEPKFTWLGLTPPELADLYYARALLIEEVGRSEFEEPTPQVKLLRITKTRDGRRNRIDTQPKHRQFLCRALELMWIARKYRSDDTHIAELYNNLKVRYGEKSWRRIEMDLEGQFHNVFEQSSGRVVWAGELMMLASFGGVDIASCLPLTQQGLEISQTFDQWFTISELYSA